MPSATSTAKAGGIKVNPPKLPVVRVPRAPAAGWETFTSPALGVAVDYPEDWLVAQNGSQGGRVSFTSPQGSTILLEGDASQPESSPTGQDCPTLINDYGQAGRLCLDAAASRYSAVFKMPAGAPVAWVILSEISQEKPTLFLQMFKSLRPVP